MGDVHLGVYACSVVFMYVRLSGGLLQRLGRRERCVLLLSQPCASDPDARKAVKQQQYNAVRVCGPLRAPLDGAALLLLCASTQRAEVIHAQPLT